MNEPASSIVVPPHVPAQSVIDFDVYNPPGLQEDFHLAWKRLQTQGLPDMVWSTRNGGHWMPTRGDYVARLMTDYANLSSRVMSVPRERAIGNRPIPGSMDPPAQTPFHNLAMSVFSPKAVQALEEDVRRLAVELIEGLQPQGQCEFVSEFGIQLPLRIFMRYANLPESDLPRLRALAEEKVRPTGRIPVAEVMGQLAGYLDPYIRSRMNQPGKDLISSLVSSPIEGRPMTHDEATRLCSQVLVAGLDTVAGMLAFTFHFLAHSPATRQTLIAHPETIPKAVEEFLRRFPLVAIGREVLQDVQVGEFTLRAGDIVVLPTMLHGLDDRLFANALEIDLTRRPAPNLTFGTGPHRCPGAPLARMELRLVLKEWLSRIPEFHVPDGGVVGYKSGVVGTVSRLPLAW